MNPSTSRKKKKTSSNSHDHTFINTMFSWSLKDIFNEDLYRNKVDHIDLQFKSPEQYFQSFVYPLLDETRAQLGSCMKILSSSPYAQVVSLEQKLSRSYGRNHYVVKTDTWKNRSSGHGKELNKTLFGDIFILADFKPKNVNRLTRSGNMWSFLLSARIPNEEIKEDDHDDTKIMSTFKVIASKDIDIDEMGQKSLFMIFLMNITSSRRIWNALHMNKHSNLIEKISLAFNMIEKTDDDDDEIILNLPSDLNKSQRKAICRLPFFLSFQ